MVGPGPKPDLVARTRKRERSENGWLVSDLPLRESFPDGRGPLQRSGLFGNYDKPFFLIVPDKARTPENPRGGA
jgi:hypothetical protein